ncbi:cytochrome P450 4C1-like [Phymastichus coffea]|uniref:cytochrome P450 4C1-like n=1 Tax=Phymastichus coffea TaxID=108790 RepID=UPI00273AD938|nr:cytochrome P450 4C1-like [Phymastichus coffea]XP_058793776.1 cytochrome P450 4C1-like [Phymastichus coffea]XP_058793777.1 cytochrome P450 4C1-like [Phymastichus coffea]
MFVVTLFYGLLILIATVTFRWIGRYFSLRSKLSAIPGPINIPFIGLTWQLINISSEDRFQFVNNLLGKYKNGITLIWIGPEPVVIITKPELIEVVLSSNTLITKASGYDSIKPWLGQGLVTSTGDLWFKHRKLITPTFHFNILEEYAAIMQDNVEILIECIESQVRKDVNTPINIFEYAVKYTLDTICETAMGVNINCQKKSDVEYVNALHKFSELAVERMFRFWLKCDALYYRTSKGQESYRAMKIMHDFTEQVILRKQSERKNKLPKKEEEHQVDEFGKRKRKAFLDLLLDESQNAENPLTTQELREEVDTFMFAGHDTTAAAISWALFALGNEQKIQDKVYDELKEVFGSETRTATTKQMRQLKYLDMVIKEVLRFYPSVPSISRYVDTETVLDGYIIPKGTTLSVNIYMLHHNPEVWENPEKFDPDRFLPENIHSKKWYAHVPFSAGPRNCIGQKFAYLELKTVLTAILRKWQVSSVLKPSEMKFISNIILRAHDGKIELYFKPRT